MNPALSTPTRYRSSGTSRLHSPTLRMWAPKVFFQNCKLRSKTRGGNFAVTSTHQCHPRTKTVNFVAFLVRASPQHEPLASTQFVWRTPHLRWPNQIACGPEKLLASQNYPPSFAQIRSCKAVQGPDGPILYPPYPRDPRSNAGCLAADRTLSSAERLCQCSRRIPRWSSTSSCIPLQVTVE